MRNMAHAIGSRKSSICVVFGRCVWSSFSWPNEIFEIFHYLLSTTYLVLGTSSRYTTKKPLILLQIQPTPHFKIHKDVIRLLIVSRPPSDNFNDRDTSIRTSRKTENQKYGLFILFTGFRPQKDVNKRKNLWVSPMCIKVLLFYNGMVLKLH